MTLHVLATNFWIKSIRADGDTDPDEADGCLRYVEVKPGMFLEEVLEISQDLEHRAHLVFDVTVISISERRACGYFASVRPPRGGWSN
jgi:hypothetical protein